MSNYESQIKTKVNEFQVALTTMAWGIAEQIIVDQKKKLTSGLTNLYINAEKIKSTTTVLSDENKSSTYLHKAACLASKVGTWTRGGGFYEVLGQGEVRGTYRLKDVKTGKEITAVATTILTRWKHIA